MKLCFLWYLYTVHVTFLCSKQGLIVGSQVIFHPGPATRFCIVEFHELCKLMSYWFLLFSKIVFLVIFETRYSDANCVWRGTHRKASLAGARCHRTACTIYTLRYAWTFSRFGCTQPSVEAMLAALLSSVPPRGRRSCRRLSPPPEHLARGVRFAGNSVGRPSATQSLALPEALRPLTAGLWIGAFPCPTAHHTDHHLIKTYIALWLHTAATMARAWLPPWSPPWSQCAQPPGQRPLPSNYHVINPGRYKRGRSWPATIPDQPTHLHRPVRQPLRQPVHPPLPRLQDVLQYVYL
jgi:hypothetical protein